MSTSRATITKSIINVYQITRKSIAITLHETINKQKNTNILTSQAPEEKISCDCIDYELSNPTDSDLHRVESCQSEFKLKTGRKWITPNWSGIERTDLIEQTGQSFTNTLSTLFQQNKINPAQRTIFQLKPRILNFSKIKSLSLLSKNYVHWVWLQTYKERTKNEWNPKFKIPLISKQADSKSK